MQSTANKSDKERILKPWGKRLADLIKEMDLTERKFAQELGYKHPSVIYAAEKVRPISRELMGKIKEFVRKRIGKEINPEWLQNGTEPKFLTEDINNISKKENKAKEEKECQACKDKDLIIEKYEKIIQQQSELIDQLTKLKNKDE